MTERLNAELVAAKRTLWKSLVDLLMIFSGLITAFIWDTKGYHRESFILIAVTYWGARWNGPIR